MKLLLLASAIGLLFHIGTSPAQQQQIPKASIEGVVVRAGTGQPVSGARVTVVRQGRGGPNGPLTAGPVLSGDLA